MRSQAIVCLLLGLVCTNGFSKEYEISQKNTNFSIPFLVIKPGDSVRFTNKDKVTHNVVSRTAEFEFDLGAFKPGMTKLVKFNHLGVVDVECTIHPYMHMSIFLLKRNTDE